ncbi:Os02g0609500 [Oryza sativa Japonica Group]|uniref:Os02g0609500 protein n=2 Tax=Oryza sativa subsp. japonica TaxID=39947 RepID=Q0DZM9_ORYSJ|nr:hypothetical protein EE612_012328 [Oryza sativa]KAF2945786.1 hypothetical protein DAI22_02g242700 [Oryza sativa Japonica Group]BAF09309.1 Os02g0609500 [Oryza sativa Japonica Group]BAS79699.1 Os02g0609500 [Oryza sativa Japonica Group]|eukprot:NP_001047395.1 Os02g0609500 [Oryza sativa Japonica Group]
MVTCYHEHGEPRHEHRHGSLWRSSSAARKRRPGHSRGRRPQASVGLEGVGMGKIEGCWGGWALGRRPKSRMSARWENGKAKE